MTRLQNLHKLVHKLKSEEVEVCRRLLTAFDRRGIKFDNKAVKLFETLLEDQTGEYTEVFISEKIYGGIKITAIQKLQVRLKAKILEMLQMDINIEREDTYPIRLQVLYSIRKQLNYAQILQARSMTSMVLHLYDEIIQQGVRYELWEEVITAARFKCGLVAISMGQSQYEKCAQSWKEYRQIYRACAFAESKYNELVLITNYRSWTEKDSIRLRENILKLMQLFEKTNSATIEYHLRRLEAHYYQQHYEYRKADECLRRIVVLTKDFDSVATKSRHSGALLDIAQNNIYLRDFETAISNTFTGLKYVPATHSTSVFFMELQFYCNFYLGLYEKALGCLKKVVKLTENFGWGFQKGKWSYLIACCEFALGNYQQVDTILLAVNPIENDKNGWNLGVRFLLILSNIEREKFDVASSRLETIRKQVNQKSHKNLSPRNKRIISLLLALDRKSFRFSDLTIKQQKALADLSSSENNLRWEILSPELILFHAWLSCKIEKVPFQQKTPTMLVRSSEALTIAV